MVQGLETVDFSTKGENLLWLRFAVHSVGWGTQVFMLCFQLLRLSISVLLHGWLDTDKTSKEMSSK